MGSRGIFHFWDGLKLRVKGLIVIAIPVVPLLLFSILFRISYRSDERNQSAVTRTIQARDQIQEMLIVLLNAETGIRGYLLTDDDAFLQPYEKAIQDLPRTEKQLENLVAGDSFQRNQLRQLDAIVGERFNHLQNLLQENRNQSVSEDSLRRSLVHGKQMMDSARKTINQMLIHESKVLNDEKEKARESQQRTKTLVIAGTLLGLFGGVLATFLFMTNIVRRIHLLGENAKRISAGEDLIHFPAGQDAISELAEELVNTQKILAEKEERRRKAAEELDRFFTLSLDMFCIAGFDGYFKRVNDSWQKTLGYAPDELISRPYLDFVHPEDQSSTVQEASNLNAGNPILTFENRYRCKDGSYKWFLWNSVPVVNEKIVYATARDITERKEIEQQIKRLNDQLSQRLNELTELNQELEAFSYSVSHDLRAPLRHIDGFSDLLRKSADGKLDGKGLHYLDVIRQSARQMGELIDDLLVFSRMARTEMLKTEVDTDSLIRNILRDFEREMENRNVKIEIRPLPRIQADPAMLRLALVNLISNAFKYTTRQKEAQIEIGCDVSNPSEPVFYVKDNGIGFDMQYSHKLFGVFQRLHSSGDFEGTGIGLANVRRIIQRHGGRTWGEGVVGRGATFYILLPQEEIES